MTDRTTSDLAALLTPAPSAGVQFSQGTILTWDRERLENTIEWRGITLRDIPMIEGLNNLVLKPGDVIGMLGWAPENSKGVGSWWILGKLSNPGEFIADLTFFLGQVRFRTKGNEYDQVYFGSDTDGDPLTVLYYGDAASTRAVQIANTNWLSLRDPEGTIIFENDSASRNGIGRPYFNYLVTPSVNSETATTGPMWPSTVSTTLVEMMHGFNTVWHPKVTIGADTTAAGGTTAWEYRIGGVAFASGTGDPGVNTYDIPGWGTTVLPGATLNFQFMLRNTAGSRSWFMVDRFYGRQT